MMYWALADDWKPSYDLAQKRARHGSRQSYVRMAALTVFSEKSGFWIESKELKEAIVSHLPKDCLELLHQSGGKDPIDEIAKHLNNFCNEGWLLRRVG